MEEKEFLLELKNCTELLQKLTQARRECAFPSFDAELEKDNIRVEKTLSTTIWAGEDNTDKLISEKEYLVKKLGQNVASASNFVNDKIGRRLLGYILGLGLIAVGVFAKFYFALGLGLICLLFCIKSSSKHIKHKKIYNKNKVAIQQTIQEYNTLKTKWVKIINEFDKTRQQKKQEIKKLENEIENVSIKKVLEDKGLFVWDAKLLFEHIQKANNDIDEGFRTCQIALKQAEKQKMINSQCSNCIKGIGCPGYGTVYNCSNFIQK